MRWWGESVSTLLNIRIHLKGRPPEPPFFLVCNHLSYLDVLPLWCYAKGTFVAKSDIKSWPFFGWATKILGVIFIDRTLRHDVQRVNDLIASRISDRQGVMIFPEGTSTSGERVKPFHTALLHYPADRDVPVHYATISYRSDDPKRPAWNHLCWWGDMDFFSHFWELLKLPGFETTITFGGAPVSGTDRKILARELHREVSALYEPIPQGQSEAVYE